MTAGNTDIWLISTAVVVPARSSDTRWLYKPFILLMF
jgi:hypothetical protein